MQKIIEKMLEPSKITVGSKFILKIKTIRHLIYEEIKDMSVTELSKYTNLELKGEDDENSKL